MVKFAQMPKYEAYKDSGVEWLGEIPDNWELIKLKFLVNIFNGDSLAPALKDKFSSSDQNKRAYIASKDISLNTSEIDYDNGIRIHQDYAEYKIAPANSSLLCIEGGSAGRKIAFTNQSVNFVNKLACFYSEKTSNKFIYYSLFTELFQTQFKLSMSGLIGGVAISSIRNFLITLPPQKEQLLIVSFLDQKISQIDAAIAIKEQQIELLKERKQIIIQQAVTQGLDPNVPMKDSGVEWIGQIPEYWEVKRAKYLFNEIDERSKTGDEELLSVSHMTGVTPRSEKSVTMIAEDYTGSKTCQKNDFIMNIMWAWMGAMGVSDRPGIVSSAYSIFRQTPLGIFNPTYLEWLLTTVGYIEHYNQVSTGLHSSRLRFYSRMFFDMEIGYPDRSEQEEIVKVVKIQSTKIEQAVQLYVQQIEKLKEYKTTLINNAVTGKIKVS